MSSFNSLNIFLREGGFETLPFTEKDSPCA